MSKNEYGEKIGMKMCHHASELLLTHQIQELIIALKIHDYPQQLPQYPSFFNSLHLQIGLHHPESQLSCMDWEMNLSLPLIFSLSPIQAMQLPAPPLEGYPTLMHLQFFKPIIHFQIDFSVIVPSCLTSGRPFISYLCFWYSSIAICQFILALLCY